MEECKGCRTLSVEGHCIGELIPYISETEHCPCLTCLVKGICSYACEEFNLYTVNCIRLKQLKKVIKCKMNA